MDAKNFHSVNNALITLIPELAEAAQVKDYLPISLIHIMGKLILKVLSNRLACKLDKLIHISQCVRVRSVHAGQLQIGPRFGKTPPCEKATNTADENRHS
jgi:hypothetical protein